MKDRLNIEIDIQIRPVQVMRLGSFHMENPCH